MTQTMHNKIVYKQMKQTRHSNFAKTIHLILTLLVMRNKFMESGCKIHAPNVLPAG